MTEFSFVGELFPFMSKQSKYCEMTILFVSFQFSMSFLATVVGTGINRFQLKISCKWEKEKVQLFWRG